MSIINVKLDDLPESDAVPGGKYRLRADEVSDPEYDKHDNQFIKITWVIVDGEYVNRKVFENYVPLQGRSLLRKITRAAGWTKPSVGDTQELVGIEVEAILRVEKSEEFGEQNRISVYITPGEMAETKRKRR